MAVSVRRGHWLPCIAFALACPLARGTGIEVGAGSALHFADSNVSLGCGDLMIAGQATITAGSITAIGDLDIAAGGSLVSGAGRISLGGNFVDAGSFASGTSRIAIVDACGSGISTIAGATSFYDLIVGTASGKSLVLPAGTTQSVTHALGLSGAAGNLLQLISSAAGQRAMLAIGAAAAQSIAYVDARDNAATDAPIAPGQAAAYNSIDGGNLVNWFAVAVTGPGAVTPIPAPAFGLIGRLALLFTLLAAAALSMRRRVSANLRE